MRVVKATLQYFEDLHRKIFRGGHLLSEFLQGIQILQMIAGEHFPFDKTVEIDQIAEHASALVNLATHGDFECIVVAVSVRIVALAISHAIFVGGHLRTVQPVRGGESITASEMRFHESPLMLLPFSLIVFSVEIDKQVRSFVDAHPMQTSFLKLAFEALPDGDREIFGRRNTLEKLRNLLVKEAVIHRVENF